MKHNFYNLLACLKNGSIAKKHTVKHVEKKLSKELLTLLWEEGYIAGFNINYNSSYKNIKIFLKYSQNLNPCISNIIAISKPGKKVYCSAKNLWKLNSSNQLLVISTNKGLKSLEFCKKNNLGGEILLIVK